MVNPTRNYFRRYELLFNFLNFFFNCTIVNDTKELLHWCLIYQVQHRTTGHCEYDETEVKCDLWNI